jgi:phosphatidylglycerol:prolipoprotein diacylglycerol transferase
VISVYGILISVSILMCIIVSEKLVPDKNEKGTVWELALWAIIPGIIGARLFHVISDFEYYRNSLVSIFYIWNGGLGIWGALAGGIFGTIYYLKKHNKPVFHWLDIFAVVVPLGQAIGRWGNFFNKEIYGPVTTLPWGIEINGIKHHPIFLYESILDLFNFAVLLFLYKKTEIKNRGGFITALFFLNYSVIRFFMEFLRQDHWEIAGLNLSMLIPILLFMAALYCLVVIQRRKI